MLADSLRRGLAAGLLAGLLAGLFALTVGEVPVREAIRLEAQAAAAPAETTADATASAHDPSAPGVLAPLRAADDVDEPGFAVSRPIQQALLPVATAIVGSALGGLFGLLWAGTRRFVRDQSDWHASWKLGATSWAAIAFVPALASPPNPPAVGDPATIGSRSATYGLVILAAVVGAAVLWWLALRLRQRGMSPIARQVAVGVGAVVLIGIVLAVVAPVDAEPIAVPPRLIWQFRLASMGTQFILWAGIAGINGWLWARAARPAPEPTPSTVPA